MHLKGSPTVTTLRCEEIRAFDRWATEIMRIPSIILMENAARSVAEAILEITRQQQVPHVVILCGPGNNGGDGYAAARHLANASVPVTIVQTTPVAPNATDAAINEAICHRMGIPVISAENVARLSAAQGAIDQATIVVDAILGSGARGAPRGQIAKLIDAANRAPAVRVAIDIPTGLQADSGEVLEPCFHAHTTVTLLAPKIGFETPAARGVLGDVIVAGIGISLNAQLQQAQRNS